MKRKILIICLLILSITGCKANNDKTVNLDKVSFKIKVEDIFAIKGRGTVIVGVIDKGTVEIGDTVLLVDNQGNKKSEKGIGGIEAFRQLLDKATKGDAVGILLEDTNHDEIDRYDYLVIR